MNSWQWLGIETCQQSKLLILKLYLIRTRFQNKKHQEKMLKFFCLEFIIQYWEIISCLLQLHTFIVSGGVRMQYRHFSAQYPQKMSLRQSRYRCGNCPYNLCNFLFHWWFQWFYSYKVIWKQAAFSVWATLQHGFVFGKTSKGEDIVSALITEKSESHVSLYIRKPIQTSKFLSPILQIKAICNFSWYLSIHFSFSMAHSP